MQSIYQVLLVIHIISGFSSLILFWVPVFTRKGGVNHKRVGQYYVYAMWSVVTTAFIMALISFASGRVVVASFLGYLAIITAQPLWVGTEVLKHKKQMGEHFLKLQGLIGLAVVVAAIGLLTVGIEHLSTSLGPVMVVFGVLGLTNIPMALKSFNILTPDARTKSSWLDDHMTELLTTGIAAHTAFLVFGASSFISELITGPLAIIPWVSPTVIGFAGIFYARKKYLPKTPKIAV